MEKVSLYVGFLLLTNPNSIISLVTLGNAVSNLFEVVEYIRRRICNVHSDFHIRVIFVETNQHKFSQRVQKTQTTVRMSLECDESFKNSTGYMMPLPSHKMDNHYKQFQEEIYHLYKNEIPQNHEQSDRKRAPEFKPKGYHKEERPD